LKSVDCRRITSPSKEGVLLDGLIVRYTTSALLVLTPAHMKCALTAYFARQQDHSRTFYFVCSNTCCRLEKKTTSCHVRYHKHDVPGCTKLTLCTFLSMKSRSYRSNHLILSTLPISTEAAVARTPLNRTRCPLPTLHSSTT
jgi:hypothetical protein